MKSHRDARRHYNRLHIRSLIKVRRISDEAALLATVAGTSLHTFKMAKRDSSTRSEKSTASGFKHVRPGY